jgi:hypothetical protein
MTDATLVYNDEGLLMKVVEVAAAAMVTYSSPYGSYSYPLALTIITTFPEGATLDAPASMLISGLWLRLPDLQPQAGTESSTDFLTEDLVGENGISYLQQTEESTISFHGVNGITDPYVEFLGLCGALGPGAQ